jgi:hypothetical protein
MHDYIENWLKNALVKIIEPDQAEVVCTGHETAAKESKKGTSSNKYKDKNPSQ